MSEMQTPRQLVATIRADWKNPYFGAVPYLDALATLDSWDQSYMYDDAKGLGMYLLSNLRTYKGETAKAVKATLKEVTK